MRARMDEKVKDDQCHSHTNHCECQHNSCISVVPIFNHLEEKQMCEIAKVMHTVSYKKGEVIYRAGNDSDSLYIVSKGKVKIYRLSESGKEQLIRILQIGDFTGELALFNECIHEAYAEAMEQVEICKMKRTDLQELLIKYPSISLKLLSEFSNRLGEAEKQTTRFATEKVDTRIALYLAECLEDSKHSSEFVLPMTKKNLASYLGTTPETISRKFYEFEDAGLIKQIAHNRIEILDLEELLLIYGKA
ncbi:Crp/Fnr family transcriptional regulator [Anaeromicropila herbilytica]|uniref:Crp/Fnr family transcriptional regulator n=1 Tax=Anaeromicropila herbilytica TaxID=2785025 RepID=A0A7R7EMR6_9FIRM|nr:Crp/Fnr family transcriptional regulator [Anaeromicropila herbilytica]BCN31810.1 Crp/Fnr family transcriptional regulator [Anaeromicropila herbilytica]